MRPPAPTLVALGSLFWLSSAQTTSTPIPTPSTTETAYWLRIIGGNSLVDNQILRSNNTYSLGITPAPHSFADHFILLTTFLAPDIASSANITIVPTNPHPGPLAGHLALNGTDSSTSTSSEEEEPDFAYNLIQTWHPEAESGSVHLDAWTSTTSSDDREWLRYDGSGLETGRWIAVKGQTPFTGVEFWAPWWVGDGVEAAGRLDGREWVEIDLEVIDAQQEGGCIIPEVIVRMHTQ